MKSIGTLLAERQVKKRPPPHEKAASSSAILALLGENDRFGRGYWLRLIGDRSYGEVLAIVKTAAGLPSRYSKGGYITNRLREPR
jgi:hypothetical protein